MVSEAQKRQMKLRKHRWEKAERPYFKCCLVCTLSCSMTIQHGNFSYDIFSCPKRDRGEPAFPYKFEEMKKERALTMTNGGNGNGKQESTEAL